MIEEWLGRWRADGPPRLPGLPQGQRRLGAARRADEADRVPAAAPALPGPDHRHHQRRHAAPLAARVQPGPRRRCVTERLGRRPGSPTSSGWSAWRRRPRIPASATASPRSSAATRSGWRPSCADRHGLGARSRRTLRRPDQAHPRVQAPAAERRSRPWRPTPTSWTATGRDAPPRVKIFAGKAAPSYWRAKLIIKLINDVARAVERGAAAGGPAEGGLPAELQRQPGRDHDPRGRPLGADQHGRHGGLGHRQHEVRAQRCRSRSARSTAPTSRSATGSGPENILIFGLTAEEVLARRREGPGPRGRDRRLPAPGAGARPDRARPLLARRPEPLPPDRRRPAPASTTSW